MKLHNVLFLLNIFSSLAFCGWNSSLLTSATNIPGNIEPGVASTFHVAFTNTGTNTWYANNVRLFAGNIGIPVTLPINRNVGVGSSYVFEVTITHPAANYHSEGMSFYLMYRSGSSWRPFGQNYQKPVTVAFLPSQFIAKLYTEALGRAPDQGGWQAYTDYFRINGCNLTTLQTIATGFFTCPEYNNLAYDDQLRALTLYRALLCRQPDRNEIDDCAGSGWTMAHLVNEITASSEFSALIGLIFSGGSYGWLSNASLPAALDVNRGVAPGPGVHVFPGGDGVALQAFLDGIPNNETVALCTKEVIPLDRTLIIRDGKTLRTFQDGTVNRQRYAAMSRLYRHAITVDPWPLVQLEDNARIENVWVDGQATRIVSRPFTPVPPPALFDNSAVNILMRGGATAVVGCRLSETAGWSNIVIQVIPVGTNILVQDNLITCYSSRHNRIGAETWPWSDGISCGSENATISFNHIVDASDVPIVLFGIGSANTQNSDVLNNTILNAGNSAYGAIGIDQSTHGRDLPGDLGTDNFAGSSIESNTIWTGTIAHYDICLMLGTRPLFGLNTDIGQNATVRSNTSGTQRVNCNIGILVNNLNNSTVQNNTILTNLTLTTGFPLHNVAVQENNVAPTTGIQAYDPITDDSFIDWLLPH